MPATLQNDPDRLLPTDPALRAIARDLYRSVAGAPIVSPHGHVDPRLLLDDDPFPDPAELFVRHDHYVTRLLHASGVPLTALGVPDRTGGAPTAAPREAWRALCAGWRLYAGTASGLWLSSTFAELFGITEEPSAAAADALYDRILERLRTPAFRPRALFERFGIEVLATTDDPLDPLDVHRELAADPTFPGRVVPTFRPDAYLQPLSEGWLERAERLAATNGSAASSHRGFLEALEGRRRHFIANGAVSADHGVVQPTTVRLDRADAERLFAAALDGSITAEQAALFEAHMLFEMARMSTEDGLVMTIHAGVRRNHHDATARRFGPDTGHDIPVATQWVDPLRPLLNAFGTTPDFHLVLFAVDESTYSREIAPLAGFYPSVYIGAPWWFLDAPDAVLRFRAAVTETAGFSRGSGFIDDTRAFLSIPARHDMSRRLDAAFLARLVGEGRVGREVAHEIIDDLVSGAPRRVFKLDR